jgi:hypothetical protein
VLGAALPDGGLAGSDSGLLAGQAGERAAVGDEQVLDDAGAVCGGAVPGSRVERVL